jgi:hypothetical protein
MTTPPTGVFVRVYGTDGQTPASSANPIPVIDLTANGQSNITNLTASIPASSTVVSLVAASSVITIVNYSSSTTMYVNFTNATATTSSFEIAAGAAFTYHGQPIQQFQILGSSASGNYGVCAY